MMRASEFGERLRTLGQHVETLRQQGSVEPGELSEGLREVRDSLAELAAAQDSVQRQLAAAHAVTEEARLLKVVQENVRSGIALLDLEFRHVRVNTMYEQALQRSREQLIGRSFFDLYPSGALRAIFEQVKDTGEPVRCDELPLALCSRGLTYWSGALAPVTDDRGRTYGLVLSLMEVTEQVRMRERLVAAEREQAETARRVTAEINHRMKNNLAMIAAVLQLQLKRYPGKNPAAGELLDAITRLGALSVVHERLYDDQPERMELVEALRRVGEISVQALSPESVDLCVSGDPVYVSPKAGSAFSMVANELITNAIKHGGPGADGRLRLAVQVALQEGKLKLSVRNSGSPVPEGFDPSAQTGLGMYLVTDFAVQYGGWVSLRPNHGGTVAEVVAEASLLA